MTKNYLVLDLATAPIADAGSYMEPVSAPANYKDPEKIAAYIADKTAERLSYVACDLDLARITAVGMVSCSGEPDVLLCPDDQSEVRALELLADRLRKHEPQLITYGGFRFDLPLVQRRARYLNVRFPWIDTSRFNSRHVDLCDVLSDRDPSRRRPLTFYVRRLGWTDLVKPLDGSEEAKVLETGQWAELAASVRHDLEASHRLAQWLNVVPALETVAEPIL